jgi:uroporphyrinogen decarboxylase
MKVEKVILKSKKFSNIKSWISSVAGSELRNAMPVLTYPGLNFTGGKVRDIVTRGEAQYNCIKAVAERYPAVASVMAMDLSVEAEAFGTCVDFKDDEIPLVKERLIRDSAMIQKLKIPRVGAARTSEYLEAAKLAAGNINDKPVFGCMIGPFSLAGRLFDISEMMVLTLMDPENSYVLIAKCTAFLKEYALMYKKCGMDGIMIAEPAAGLLSARMCGEFSSVYIREIVDYVQDDSFMVILHNCGNTVKLVESMASTGAMGLHFGNAVDMMEILSKAPPDRLVFGNIDPVGIIMNSDPHKIKSAVGNLLERTAGYRNFILSSGCDIPFGTPEENIDAFFEALEEHNKKLII